MGAAVLEDFDLVDYRVITLRNGRQVRQLLNQAHQRMMGLLNDYRPQAVVIEKPFFAKTKRSALLVFLVQELRRQVQDGNLKLIEYSPLQVRQILLGNAKATKRDIASFVAKRYPQLEQHLHVGDPCRERYWSHVFDAVALGLAVEKTG